LAAVVPIPNTVFEPGLRTTTVLYGLHFRPGVGEIAREELVRRFAGDLVPVGPGDTVEITGTAPAAAARSEVIDDRLPSVELATLILVAAAVGVFFRSLVAPVIALATVAVAYATVRLCTLGSRPVYHPGKTFPPVRETKPPRLPGIPT
jgi:predicted RND superfamily exporter protein